MQIDGFNHETHEIHEKDLKPLRCAYPKYKPSGVEWLGDVPEHWGVKRLKFVGSAFIGLTYSPEDIVDENCEEEKYLVLRSTNLQNGLISLHDNVYVTTKIAERLKIRKDDILICSRNGSRHLVGKNAIVKQNLTNVTFGAFTTVFRSTMNKFMFFAFNSSMFEYQSRGFLTTTINQLTNENLNSVLVAVPPSTEQQIIADYLDLETGKIDSLVAKKKRIVELLKEKRTALISKAVTKGLVPQVKMKPSKVEWLGDVPEHWEVKKLKHVVHLKSGDGITAEEFEDDAEYPVYGGNGLRGYTNKYTHDGQFVLIGRQGALCGNINYANGKFWASEHAVVATPNQKIATFWLGELLRIMNLNQYSISAAQPGLAIDRIKELHIPCPPPTEQQAIAEYLDQQTKKIDLLIVKIETALKKLNEYRTALISAAVTGKIDVRKA